MTTIDRDTLESDACPQPYNGHPATVENWVTLLVGPKPMPGHDGKPGEVVREFGMKGRYIWSRNWESLEDWQ